MSPIAGSTVRKILDPSTSSPGPSNAPGTSRVRQAEPDTTQSTPKRRKLKLSEFQRRNNPAIDNSDSDESIGPSVSQRGLQNSTPRQRPGIENRQPHRRHVQHSEVSSSNQVAVYDPEGPRRPRKKNWWTPEETDLVRRGFNRYGTTCRLIRERYFPDDSPRSIENIRDKIKTMQKRGELPYL